MTSAGGFLGCQSELVEGSQGYAKLCLSEEIWQRLFKPRKTFLSQKKLLLIESSVTLAVAVRRNRGGVVFRPEFAGSVCLVG